MQDKCDELRAFALSILDSPIYDVRGEYEDGGNGIGGWSAEEDALLVWLREKYVGMSWEDSFDLFKSEHDDTEHSIEDIRNRYKDFLHPQASERHKGAGINIGDEMRARALSMMDFIRIPTDDTTAAAVECNQQRFDSKIAPNTNAFERLEDDFPEHPALANIFNKKWTAEEDAHLIQLRENHEKDSTWAVLKSGLGPFPTLIGHAMPYKNDIETSYPSRRPR
jgi:hypothetical protein